MKVLVTGGAGFIGSHFIRLMMKRKDVQLLINLDKLTYAGHLEGLRQFNTDKRYRFVRGDIASPALVQRLMNEVDHVVNFAAETHVDRSIHDASPFLHTNVVGVQVLLEAARQAKVKRFLQISTDEVYGSLDKGFASETSHLFPRSPYSASKAASDHLAMAYFHTHGLPALITRAGNNYGSYQYPEKFLPLFITHAMTDQPLPLYGDGKNVREWLHVEDHCLGIEKVLRKGKPGEIYNIGTGRGWTNIAVAKTLLRYLGKPDSLITYVPDRLGHDRRYALSIAKIKREVGWSPAVRFEEGLIDTIEWYKQNRAWWEAILYRSKTYRRYYSKQYAREGVKVLVTGASGLLGHDVWNLFERKHELVAIGRSRAPWIDAAHYRECDLTNAAHTYAVVTKENPEVVVHCAAYNNVDEAEAQPELAYRGNALATRNLALACQRFDATLISVSTDYVFDGSHAPATGYREFDPCSPVNHYAESKRWAEIFVERLLSKYFIVRTSWLFGPARPTWVDKVVDLSRANQPILAATDMVSSPTYTPDLAQGLLHLAESRHYGTYHLTNQGFCSRVELAQEILKLHKRGDYKNLQKMKVSDIRLPARRPSFSALDNLAWKLDGFPPLRSWKEALQEHFSTKKVPSL